MVDNNELNNTPDDLGDLEDTVRRTFGDNIIKSVKQEKQEKQEKKKTEKPTRKESQGMSEASGNDGSDDQPNLDLTPEEAEIYYKQTVTSEPPIEVDIPSFDGGLEQNSEGEPQTLTDAINNGADLTDMQFTAEKLFPTKLGNKVQNALMVARIDPQVFLPMLHLNAVDEIQRSDPTKSIDVTEIYNKYYVLLSKGLDGMGIIDLLELSGAAREEKRMDRQFGALAG